MRKILYSPGFSAGWSSWNSGDAGKFMLTYQPIIDYLEAGNTFTYEDANGDSIEGGPKHPLLIQLQKECNEKFGNEYVCVLGASDLEVATVDGLYRITEYDGNENIEFTTNVRWEVADEH